MSKIKIKHFGPIKEGITENGGWIDIKKVTVFIGNQGSGKSTVAKLISTFVWIEKALVRGDNKEEWFEYKNRLKNRFLTYHRIENYLTDKSNIEYIGEAYSFTYKEGALSISKVNETYPLPQIMYVPAERNFIAYVKKPNELKLSSESLKEFLTEFDNAKEAIKTPIHLPINNVDLEYDKLNDVLNLKGSDFKVRLTEASSGFQSLVPQFIVTRYLAEAIKNQSGETSNTSTKDSERFRKDAENILMNASLTDEQKRIAMSILSARFNKSAFINIVEEPEQNLFPSSQWNVMKSLLAYNNSTPANKLIITTHSPYLINGFTIAVKTGILKEKAEGNSKLTEALNNVYPIESAIHPDDLAIYELEETDGSIKLLKTYNGLPSDENYLNTMLDETNDTFANLLEIQQQL